MWINRLFSALQSIEKRAFHVVVQLSSTFCCIHQKSLFRKYYSSSTFSERCHSNRYASHNIIETVRRNCRDVPITVQRRLCFANWACSKQCNFRRSGIYLVTSCRNWSVGRSVGLLVCPSVCRCVGLPVCPFVCLSRCLLFNLGV